ncbi:MAG: hypothetical protein ABI297_08735 [Ginsengibacter sp.]
MGCGQSNIFFTIDAKVYPDKDSINIGDTIYAEIDIPTTLKDKNDDMVDYSKANNLGTDMGFLKLVNDSSVQVGDAVNDFGIQLISGKEVVSSNPLRLKEYSFEETGGRYIFKISIVPKSSGTFSFNFGNAANVIRNGNSCPKAEFSFLLRNTTDQHYYLFPSGSGVAPAGADYYFYVR